MLGFQVLGPRRKSGTKLASVRLKSISEDSMRNTSTILIGLISACVFMVACAKEASFSANGQGGSTTTGGSAATGGSAGGSWGSGGTKSASGGDSGSMGGVSNPGRLDDGGTGTGGIAGGSSGGTGGTTICPAIACLLPD
jgi:hypothetical protein